ncbi:MAG: hypothetical protein ACNI28_01780 [Arcobacter sp.]|uniref:hypothetical protein n=1 Tax=Arcobacter sp. TaxID=1872629 RepID=UPI003AFFAFC3
MRLKSLIILFIFLMIVQLSAKEKVVETLLEKVNQASTPKEKKQLIEKLKVALAKKNKKAREEANAIIKAKQKVPIKLFSDKALAK